MNTHDLASLSPANRARFLTIMAKGGIRGGDGEEGSEPTVMERLDAQHAMLSDDGARSRLLDAEIGEMHAELRQLFTDVRAGEVEAIEASDTAALRRIGECMVALVAETVARYAAAAATAEEVASLEAELGLVEEAEGGEETPAEGAPATEGEQVPAEAQASGAEGAEAPATEPAPEGTPEPVVASAAPRRLPSLAELNRRAPRPRVAVEDVLSSGPEEGLIRWVPTGESIDRNEFVRRMANYGETLSGGAPQGMKVVLGQIDTLGGNAQRINSRTDSPEAVAAKLDAAVLGAMDPANWSDGRPSDALLASGGWGAPSPIDYSVDTIAVADRPVRAALASVGVDRGGLTWVRQPKFSDVTTGGPTVTTAAIGIWTHATDTTPGSTVKSHQVVPTPSTTNVQLDALYMALQNGVLQSRAYPEWVAAWQRNTEAAWARMAETFLLDKIEGASITKFVSQANVIGAARDYLTFVIALVSAERNRQRMRPDAMVRLLYPALLEDLIAIDLLRAGTSFVDAGPQVVARNWLTGQLRAANINGSAYIDSSTAGGQLASAQSDQHSLNAPNRTFRSYIFHEGAFVVGDGGALDLGIVRDADLVNTNDFRNFSESFEAVFDRGQWAYTLDTLLCPNGQAAGYQDLEHFCTTGS